MAPRKKTEEAPSAAPTFDARGYMEAREYADDERLYSIGEAADRFFLVKRGRVRVTASRSGKVLVDLLGPGEVAGRMPRLAGATFDETATADGAAEVWILHARDLARFTADRPQAAAALVEGLALRSDRLAKRVQSFAFREVKARIAEMLLDLAERHGESSEEGEFEIGGVTQSDLGDLVGCARAFASTIFNELKRENAVNLSGRTIVIRNQRVLRKAALEEHLPTR